MVSLDTLQGASSVVILCRAGPRLCALPIQHVSLTMRPVPVEAIADAPPFVLGLAVVRGAPVPVVDAARLLGVEAECTGADRYVIVRVGSRSVALAVQAVVGVERLASNSASELPPLLSAASRNVISQMTTLDSALLFVLECARLVPETLWAALEGKGASA
jgi:purine-binding chemotaxis protein CheW